MTLMSIWAACQPTPVTPQPGDVVKGGRRYRRINGEWAVYISQAGDWYRSGAPDNDPDRHARAGGHGESNG